MYLEGGRVRCLMIISVCDNSAAAKNVKKAGQKPTINYRADVRRSAPTDVWGLLLTGGYKIARACMGTNGMGIPSNMGWDWNGMGIPQWDTRFPSHRVPSRLKFLPHLLPHNRYSTAPIPPASHPTIGTATPVPIPL